MSDFWANVLGAAVVLVFSAVCLAIILIDHAAGLCAGC